MDTYDHIVVGAGIASCVVASRLGEDPTCALRLVRELAKTKAMTPWRRGEVLPGGAVSSDEGVRAFLGSTCRMGQDQGSVTDLDLRVHGVDGLRVVDASVLPSLPSANTNATVLAIAERAVDLLLTGSHPNQLASVGN